MAPDSVALEQLLVAPTEAARLADRDPHMEPEVARQDAEQQTAANVEEITELQRRLWAQGKHALLVVLQGMDAAGKDGLTRKVFGPLNPAGVSVTSFKAPTWRELKHDFLWRVHQHAPAKGRIAIFNRSHYEDVLVVRVDELAPEATWRARYGHINAFEHLLTDSGTTILKFFLHISAQEQRERLIKRIENPDKRWKHSADDFRKRSKWTTYMEAYEEALTRCSTPHAPWRVIPADRKWYRNLLVSEVVLRTLRDIDPRYPEAGISEAEQRRLLDHP